MFCQIGHLGTTVLAVQRLRQSRDGGLKLVVCDGHFQFALAAVTRRAAIGCLIATTSDPWKCLEARNPMR
jgi:hypothetical protein